MAQGTGRLSTLRSSRGWLSLAAGGYPGQGLIVTDAISTTPVVDTLTLQYGATSFTFEDVRVVRSVMFMGGGERRMRHQIQDERWKLLDARVSGRFNRRGGDGEPVDDDYKKNLRELLEEAFSQANFEADVSEVSEEEFPEVDWDEDVAASAIDVLCARYSVRLCPVSDGTWKVWPLGEGDDLPAGGSRDNASRSFESAKPKEIQVVGGKTIFQAMFRLRAVALDTDNSWQQPIDLSYRPAFGWGSESPNSFAGVPYPARAFALRTVWRYYQVENWQQGPPDFTNLDPDDITQAEQARPLLPFLLESGEDKLTPEQQSQPPRIYGDMARGNMLMSSGDESTEYLGEFEIDGEAARVFFPRPVYKFTAGQTDEARLFLVCSYNARHENGKWDRFKVTREIDANAEGVLVLDRPDLVRRAIQNYIFGAFWQKDSIDDNFNDLKAIADGLLDSAEGLFAEGAEDIGFDGFVDAFPNGKIQRVKFSWGRQAYTRASQFMDFDYHSNSVNEQVANSEQGLYAV